MEIDWKIVSVLLFLVIVIILAENSRIRSMKNEYESAIKEEADRQMRELEARKGKGG